MLKELLEKFLNQDVRLVKDDGFVINGIIKEVHDDSILFFSDGRNLILSFDRIKEVVPLRGERHG